MTDVYSRQPRSIIDGIPSFMGVDAYTESYEAIANDHLSVWLDGDGNPFIAEAVWRDIEENTVRLLKSLVRPGDRILDIGVGTGRLLSHVPQARRYGVDVSMAYLRHLGASGITTCQAKVEDLPYRGGSFDVVACTDVLEHVLDLNAAVAEIRRVLKPGGTLLLRVPYEEDLSLYLSDRFPYRYGHVRTFDEHALRLLLSRVFDFEIDACMFDRAFVGAKFAVPLPRGRSAISRVLGRVADKVPFVRQWLLRTAFDPVEVTMTARKPIAAGDPVANAGEQRVAVLTD